MELFFQIIDLINKNTLIFCNFCNFWKDIFYIFLKWEASAVCRQAFGDTS